MREILRLSVAPVETREDAEDFRRPLRAERRVGGGKARKIEFRLRELACMGVGGEQFELELRRDVDARILKQGSKVIGRMADDRILKIDEAELR